MTTGINTTGALSATGSALHAFTNNLGVAGMNPYSYNFRENNFINAQNLNYFATNGAPYLGQNVSPFSLPNVYTGSVV